MDTPNINFPDKSKPIEPTNQQPAQLKESFEIHLGMQFTSEQWKMFMNNLCQQINSAIQKETEKMKEALRHLRGDYDE